jgi:hypothetical protein
MLHVFLGEPYGSSPFIKGLCFQNLTVVSRQRFFSVAPDRSHVIETMMADLGELRGFGVGWC